MAILSTILVTLLGVSLSYGFAEAGTYIENAINKTNGVDPIAITSAIDKILNEAKASGNTIYNQVLNKLSDVKTMAAGSNGAVREIYRNAIDKYQGKLSDVEQKLKTLDSKGTTIQQKAQTLANESGAYRVAYGKDELDKLKRETTELRDSLNFESNNNNTNNNKGDLQTNYEKKI